MDFQPAKKQISSCSVRRLSIVVLMFSLFLMLFRMGISDFRTGTLRVLLGQILNLTTSDTRQDGQPSPFTASLSQRVRETRNCRGYVVAETEKPFLMGHQRLYPLLFAFNSLFIVKNKYAGLPFRSSSDSKSFPRGDESNSTQHSGDSPRAHT